MSSIKKNMCDQLRNGPSLLEVSLEHWSAKIICYQRKNSENSKKEKKIISHPRLTNSLWKNFCRSTHGSFFRRWMFGVSQTPSWNRLFPRPFPRVVRDSLLIFYYFIFFATSSLLRHNFRERRSGTEFTFQIYPLIAHHSECWSKVLTVAEQEAP